MLSHTLTPTFKEEDKIFITPGTHLSPHIYRKWLPFFRGVFWARCYPPVLSHHMPRSLWDIRTVAAPMMRKLMIWSLAALFWLLNPSPRGAHRRKTHAFLSLIPPITLNRSAAASIKMCIQCTWLRIKKWNSIMHLMHIINGDRDINFSDVEVAKRGQRSSKHIFLAPAIIVSFRICTILDIRPRTRDGNDKCGKLCVLNARSRPETNDSSLWLMKVA
jgi:hypothetical protein